MIDAAWTDAVLALVCAGLGLWLWGGGSPSQRTGGIGLVLVGTAATLGALRYGGVDGVENAHMGVTRLAEMVGLPMVGVGYATASWPPDWANRARSIAFVLLLIAAVLGMNDETFRLGVGVVGLAAVVVGALGQVRRDPVVTGLAGLGVAGVAVARFAILGDGDLGPMSRIAWFHLAFAGCVALLGAGLVRLEAPSGGASPSPSS